MQRTPSMQALRAIESFARHGTIWQAADELNLTRSAISHQLRLLERDLGFQLFNRVGTKVELTAQGAGYAADVRRALNTISGSATRHAARGVSGAVTVSCTPGFASNWLCHRISGFRDAYPDVRLSIVTPRRLDDVSNPEVDLFIAFGTGNWPDMKVKLLQEVDFTPLCSPALMNKVGGLNDPADIVKTCLLHLTDHQDWERWLAEAGIDHNYASTGIVFSDMNLVYSATISAQGLAMGDEFICRTHMETGQLVRPFDIAIRSSSAYYMVVSEAKADSQSVEAFQSWLEHDLIQKEANIGTI